MRRWTYAVGSAVAGIALTAAMFVFGGVGVSGMRGNAVSSSALNSGQRQGIKVHGKWTVQVKNADGAVVQTRHFENALSANGSLTIGDILTDSIPPAVWQINIEGPANTGGVCGSFAGNCYISQAQVPNTKESTNLQVTPPTSDSKAMKLQGSYTAVEDGQIAFVDTEVMACKPQSDGTVLSVAACRALIAQKKMSTVFGYPLTSHVLKAPIDVKKGQEVLVTVLISFT